MQNSNAQALWMWTVTPAGNTIVKEFRQLQLPQRLVLTGGNLSAQFLEGTCPDVNGALVNGFLGRVWQQLPPRAPTRALSQLLGGSSEAPVSVFHVDASTSLCALKAAMERGGFTRAAINNALETKISSASHPRRATLPRAAESQRDPDGQHVGREHRIVQAESGRSARRSCEIDEPVDNRKRRRGPRL